MSNDCCQLQNQVVCHILMVWKDFYGVWTSSRMFNVTPIFQPPPEMSPLLIRLTFSLHPPFCCLPSHQDSQDNRHWLLYTAKLSSFPWPPFYETVPLFQKVVIFPFFLLTLLFFFLFPLHFVAVIFQILSSREDLQRFLIGVNSEIFCIHMFNLSIH